MQTNRPTLIVFLFFSKKAHLFLILFEKNLSKTYLCIVKLIKRWLDKSQGNEKDKVQVFFSENKSC